MVIELETSENTARLVGKDIFDFVESVAFAIRKLVLTTECSDLQKVSTELNTVLKDEGRTKVLLKLILKKHKVSILLPNSYSVTPHVIYEISNLNWMKDLEINQ
ncbi:MAG: hypothetical protein PG981_001246 [Wolbachia endosymbiont of Ctenocephalides orientis wCori]|nr:MAG: hypothetical protein PG981_001246 [Wolbachia endosymbiont of Ctenocephalides orientis wCori]